MLSSANAKNVSNANAKNANHYYLSGATYTTIVNSKITDKLRYLSIISK